MRYIRIPTYQIAVTGAASGMGLAIAELLAARGATVSIADRNEQGLQATMKKLSGSGHIYEVIDVTKSATVDAWIQRTVKELARLDGAVNFAGIATLGRIVDMTDEEWDLPFNVNTKGVFYCMRAQLRVMKEGASIVRYHDTDSSLPRSEVLTHLLHL